MEKTVLKIGDVANKLVRNKWGRIKNRSVVAVFILLAASVVMGMLTSTQYLIIGLVCYLALMWIVGRHTRRLASIGLYILVVSIIVGLMVGT